mgnify:CR=1 FL=1
MILINLIPTKLLELVRNAALISRIVQPNPCNTHISLKLFIGYKDLVETHFDGVNELFQNNKTGPFSDAYSDLKFKLGRVQVMFGMGLPFPLHSRVILK